MDFILFVLIGIGVIACLGDVYYTQSGLKMGLVEANPVNKFLFSKLGEPLTAFLEISAFIIIATLFGTKLSYAGGLVIAGGVTVTETFMTIRNYKLVKAATAKPAVKK